MPSPLPPRVTGLLALAVSCGCLLVLSHDRLWLLATLAIGAIGALPALIAVQARHSLADNVACARAFGLPTMPATYLIDRRGVVRRVHSGFVRGDAASLRAQVEQLLAEPARETRQDLFKLAA